MPHEHQRVSLPHATSVAPFLKWLGGKRWLIEHGLRVPALKKGSTYFEPFLGAGSLYFALRPERAILSDTNPELVNAYQQVATSVEKLIELLEAASNDPETYGATRESAPASPLERAYRFLYLNRTAYGGMYRVNRAGQFNVPFGNYVDRRICQPEILRAAAQALSCADIHQRHYAEAALLAKEGDFVYFDPPYDSHGTKELFARYTSSAFTWDMHVDLASLALELSSKGVHVLVSNTAHPDVAALYVGMHAQFVKRSTRLSRDARQRGLVEEGLFASYPNALAD